MSLSKVNATMGHYAPSLVAFTLTIDYCRDESIGYGGRP